MFTPLYFNLGHIPSLHYAVFGHVVVNLFREGQAEEKYTLLKENS